MKKFTIFLLGFLVCLNISIACINDSASRTFEMQPFPNEQQLISGSFHVHSKAFHEWRIKDRLKKLEKDPDNPALLDDLAVSYEKTGQTQIAIDTLQSVLHKYPNRYETLANLGTFYIHHQEYEKGLQLLKKAIKINPEAHYGREIYQIKVVEYILSLNKKPPFVFPIQNKENFADFLLKGIKQSEQKDELIRAIVGVSGMLKFGNSDSPILLEVLGDLYARYSKDYLTHFYIYSQTHLSNISKDFYTASFLRSNLSDKNILSNFFNSRKELASSEFLFKLYYNKVNTIEDRINNIQTNLHEAQAKRDIHNNQEKEIIQKTDNNNLEKEIYNNFYKSPEEQPNLVNSKKRLLNDITYLSNLEFKMFIVEYISTNIIPLIIVTLFFSTIVLFNIIYHKTKSCVDSNNELAILCNNLRSYLFWGNFTAIVLLFTFGSILLETFTQWQLYEFIKVLLLVFSIILVITMLFVLSYLTNGISKTSNQTTKYAKMVVWSKHSLYFSMIGGILFAFFSVGYSAYTMDQRNSALNIIIDGNKSDNIENSNIYTKDRRYGKIL